VHTRSVSVPLLARAAALRVDGVGRALGDAAVLSPTRRAAFAGTLPWSLELRGPAAERLAKMPGVVSGRPGAAVAARLLEALRPLLLRAGCGQPRFALCTVDRIEVAPTTLRLAGTCAPLLPPPTVWSLPAV
jgi:hypothetical protein